MVLVLAACPAGLRGDLTKWLTEISAGVFVGNPSARVRDHLWHRVVELSRDGRAVLVHSAENEQHLSFRTHNHDWTPIDVDGLALMLRPTEPSALPAHTGWSAARVRKRATQPSWRRPPPDTG